MAAATPAQTTTGEEAALQAVAAAMREHPELVRGPGAPDTVLMQRLPGWTAKGGAEALLCAASPEAAYNTRRTVLLGSRSSSASATPGVWK